jgi:gliding motility-associated-like protein
MMDELRVWNRSLSEAEVRTQMCRKLTGQESGLIGYWDFNETQGVIVTDKSPNHYDGVLRGEPKRVFSGAPIGDTSVFVYANDWQDRTLSLRDSLDDLRILNVTGNPKGLHAYEVKASPSQRGTLDITTAAEPYFGVFTAGEAGEGFFDVNYTYDGSSVCRLFTRPDNSFSSWTANPFFLSQVPQRNELIKQRADFPLAIDLGRDESPCSFRPKTLNPLTDTTGFDFTWQDGSKRSSLEIHDFGTYWLTVDNGCNSASDTLKISGVPVDSLKIPNIITPNGDKINEVFEIDRRMLGARLAIYDSWGKQVFASSDYQNEWDGRGLSSGVYFYSLIGGDCIKNKRGIINILR